jgi:hypothetical protein
MTQLVIRVEARPEGSKDIEAPAATPQLMVAVEKLGAGFDTSDSGVKQAR